MNEPYKIERISRSAQLYAIAVHVPLYGGMEEGSVKRIFDDLMSWKASDQTPSISFQCQNIEYAWVGCDAHGRMRGILKSDGKYMVPIFTSNPIDVTIEKTILCEDDRGGVRIKDQNELTIPDTLYINLVEQYSTLYRLPAEIRLQMDMSR